MRRRCTPPCYRAARCGASDRRIESMTFSGIFHAVCERTARGSMPGHVGTEEVLDLARRAAVERRHHDAREHALDLDRAVVRPLAVDALDVEHDRARRLRPPSVLRGVLAVGERPGQS
jgi:hypothetical protein